MKRIPVLLTANEKYAAPMSVTAVSILQNAAADTFIDFFLMVPSDFSENAKLRFQKLGADYPRSSFTFIDMRERYQGASVQTAHLDTPIYYRLSAAELLPDLDKCIYLDSDVIVLKDLQPLYETELREDYIAAVLAPGFLQKNNWNRHQCEVVGLPDMSGYINSGVLIMNLAQIRKDALQPIFEQLAFNHYPSEDQDVLNKACFGRITHLPYPYNVICGSEYSSDFLSSLFPAEEILEAETNPCMLHFANGTKPWHDFSCQHAASWWKYAAFSPFAGQIIQTIAQDYLPDPQGNSSESRVFLGKDREIKDLKSKLMDRNTELTQLYDSVSYRLGNRICRIPAKLKSLFQKHP